MIFVGILAVFVTIGGLGLAIVFQRRDGDIINPFNMFFMFIFFNIVFPAMYLSFTGLLLREAFPHTTIDSYTMAVALTLMATMTFALGYVAVSPATEAATNDDERSTVTPLFACLVIFGIGCALKLVLLAKLGGFENALVMLSPSMRRAELRHDIGLSDMLIIASLAMEAGALLLTQRAIKLRKDYIITAVACLATVALAYLTTGKRSAIAPLFLALLCFIHYHRKAIAVWRLSLAVIVIMGIMVAFLFVRIYVPNLASGNASSAAEVTKLLGGSDSQRWVLNIFNGELGIFHVMAVAANIRDRILEQIGGSLTGFVQYNLVGFTYIIPRAVWPGKPEFSDLSLVLNDIVQGHDDSGIAIGAVGGWYVLLGPVGMCLVMVLLGVLSRLVYRKLRPRGGDPRNVFMYVIFLWVLFTLLRSAFLGLTFLTFMHTVSIPLVLAMVLMRRRAGQSHEVFDEPAAAATATPFPSLAKSTLAAPGSRAWKLASDVPEPMKPGQGRWKLGHGSAERPLRLSTREKAQPARPSSTQPVFARRT